jgi:hypothetical protein
LPFLNVDVGVKIMTVEQYIIKKNICSFLYFW